MNYNVEDIKGKMSRFLDDNLSTIANLTAKIGKTCYENFVPLTSTRVDRSAIDILVLTATPIETNVFLSYVEGLETAMARNGHIYSFGRFGEYYIVHVESKPGTGGRGASEATTRQAIEDWHPKMVVSVGIAYGNDIEKHKLGDVIFLTMALSYSGGKITTSEFIWSKNLWAPSPDAYITNLFGLFERVKFDFNIHGGPVITGENVISDAEFKDKIFSSAGLFRPVGGEMESYGIYKAADEAAVKYCFMLKGICDWGIHKNCIDELDQDNIQLLAANNAVLVLKKLLDDATFFAPISIRTVDDFFAVKVLTEQFSQHPDLLSSVRKVYDTWNKYKNLYNRGEDERRFLTDLKKHGFVGEQNELTDKGILLLFRIVENNEG